MLALLRIMKNGEKQFFFCIYTVMYKQIKLTFRDLMCFPEPRFKPVPLKVKLMIQLHKLVQMH